MGFVSIVTPPPFFTVEEWLCHKRKKITMHIIYNHFLDTRKSRLRKQLQTQREEVMTPTVYPPDKQLIKLIHRWLHR